MNVLTALTYYRPYVSGQTLYAARLAEALAGRGHSVTVLTSRYDPTLPKTERLNGVHVVRLDVGLRLGKGPLMPGFLTWGWKLARQADVIHLHLPQFDAALLSVYGRILHKPVVLTYHCDLTLPPGLINRLAGAGSNLTSLISTRLASRIVTNTTDYAAHSAILRHHLRKVTAIQPPIEIECVPEVTPENVRATLPAGADGPGPFIGMVGRLAAEKGAEILAQALPKVREHYPTAMVLHGGEHENVPGEADYIAKIKKLAAALNTGAPAWRFLGRISDSELADLMDTCALTVLPSLNSTESFGMVQVESMARGRPVVASNLPGVREPVRMTGMGEIVSPGSSSELANAILQILDHPEAYRTPAVLAKRDQLIQAMRPDSVATAYEALFKTV